MPATAKKTEKAAPKKAAAKKSAPKKTATKKEDPCWDGYEQIGEKKKNGKEVPNCVPEKKGTK